MRQIILIGFSTTGKSTLADKIVDKFPNRTKFDTDEEIAKGYSGSIANIYYSNTILEDSHKLIQRLEENILTSLKSKSDNLIIAAGPGIPFKESFPYYIVSKRPQVVLLEKPAEEIYDSLIYRRNKMRTESQHQRPDFGIWDIGVIVNEKLVEYSKEDAIQRIQLLLDERQEYYNKYATLRISSIDIFKDTLPQEFIDII